MCQHRPWRSVWPAWWPWPSGGATVSQMSRVKAQRARENSAHVRELLTQRQPEFAAALACAEQDFSCLSGREQRRGRHDSHRQGLSP